MRTRTCRLYVYWDPEEMYLVGCTDRVQICADKSMHEQLGATHRNSEILGKIQDCLLTHAARLNVVAPSKPQNKDMDHELPSVVQQPFPFLQHKTSHGDEESMFRPGSSSAL